MEFPVSKADSCKPVLPDGWADKGSRPLEIDVGCHKGLFLAEMASRYPERNFFGIERQFERVEKTRKKIGRIGLTNAAVSQGDGRAAIEALPSCSADHIHVLFPDPWPKRRHHLRRLIQPEFLSACARALKPGGLLRLVTDDSDYAAWIAEIAPEAPEFEILERDDREYPLTEFQTKFLADGRPVYGRFLRRLQVINSL